MQQNPITQQVNPSPNIVAGFKNNIGPATQNFQMPPQQIPVLTQLQPLPQPLPQPVLTQPLPQPHSQPQLQPQPQLQLQQVDPVTQVTGAITQVVTVTDTYSIFGYDLQKKYIYIAFVILFGICVYFLWKWWYGPKKMSKKGKYQPEEMEEEYTEEEEEEEDDVYIPQYPHTSKSSEVKGNRQKDDE
jgi:cbb3-type cytochrome oxidase subunit 3